MAAPSPNMPKPELTMSKIFSVSNSEDLKSALNSATGGDIIELASGDYGQLDLITFQASGVKAIYDSPVTITSADPENRASFSGIDLREVKNLTFDNIVFDSAYTGEKIWVNPFSITTSEGITIRNSLFEGELASGTGDATVDGFATGKGLRVTRSSDIAVEDNEFNTWFVGLDVASSRNVQVSGNDVHSMRSDGMNFSTVTNVVIEDNYIHDFARSPSSGDHPDMIQFWTYGAASPTTDVIIRNNTLDIGSGSATQSLFMRNEQVDNGLAGEEMFYQNILIEENVILNSHHHGITVGEAKDLVIRKNSILDSSAIENSSGSTPKINISPQSKDVIIEKNVVAEITGSQEQDDWTIVDNALVQNNDIDAINGYKNEFIESSMAGKADSYMIDPEGEIASLDAGATRLHVSETVEQLRPLFDVSKDPNNEEYLVFDATHTQAKGAFPTSTDANFIWDFGDGYSATGQIARHAYLEPGHYEAVLTVEMANGTLAKTTSEIAVKGADTLSYDASSGFFYAESYGSSTKIERSDGASVSTDANFSIDIGGEGVATGVNHAHFSELFGAENFDLSMVLRADVIGSAGEVFGIHGNILFSVLRSGEIKVDVQTSVQNFSLTTKGAKINNGEEHNVQLSFDSETNSLVVYVDDEIVGEAEVNGEMRDDFPRNLNFGSPWGKENFDGRIASFDLDIGNQQYPDFEGGPVDNVSSKSVISAEGESSTSESDPSWSEPANIPSTPLGDEPAKNDESSLPKPLLDGGYRLEFATGTASEHVGLHGDTHLAKEAESASLVFDGLEDSASLGRLTEYVGANRIAFSVDFVSGNTNGGTERLVWNHTKLGLTLEGDGIRVHARNNDDDFHRGFEVDNLGLSDGNQHNATVMVDTVEDRLQIVVDHVLVLDEQDVDFDLGNPNDYDWGWSLGAGWGRWFEGEVHEFQVSDNFEFVHTVNEDDPLNI